MPSSQKNYDALRATHREAINTLNEPLSIEQKKLQELQDSNKDDLRERHRINNAINSAKSKGKTLLIWGVIIAVIGGIMLLSASYLMGAILAVAGISLIVFGRKAYIAWKQYEEPKQQIDLKLSDYDAKATKIQNEINRFSSEIRQHESAIEALDKEERFECISTGYVCFYISQGGGSFIDKPYPPEAKYYSSSRLDFGKIYINDMVYATVRRNRGSGSGVNDRFIGFAKIDEPGTQKLQLYAQYMIAPSTFDLASEPTPINPQNGSVFCWLHLAVSQKGTGYYCTVYHDVESFLNATGISEKEILDYV